MISEYVRAVRKIYGHHLKQVILYGSYASGDYTKDSDVDLMLLGMMPIVKNRKNFFKWSDAYPFYKNVKTRGFYCMKQPKDVNV